MSDNYDRLIFPDKSYDFIAPKKAFIDNMKEYFPDNKQDIDVDMYEIGDRVYCNQGSIPFYVRKPDKFGSY